MQTVETPAPAPLTVPLANLAAPAKPSLAGMTRAELAAAVKELGEPEFRVKQLWHWIYHRGATDFAVMTSIAKGLRAKLAERYSLDRPAQVPTDHDPHHSIENRRPIRRNQLEEYCS